MSEPAPKRQPLIDLYEFERRMRGETALAIGDGKFFEREADASAGAEPEHAPIMASRQNTSFPAYAEDHAIPFEAAEPVIGGDFAEIEAALLRAALVADPARQDADAQAFQPIILPALRATRDHEDEPFAFASAPFSAFAAETGEGQPAAFSALDDERLLTQAPVDHFVYVDDAAVSGEAALYEEEKRSRRPLYLMAAVVIAGMAGIITSSALKRDAGSDDRSEPMQTAAMAPASTAAAEASSAASPAPAAGAETSAPQAAAPQLASIGQAPAETPAADAAPAQAAGGALSLQDAATPPTAAMGSLLAPPPYGAARTSAAAAAAPAAATVAQAPAASAPVALGEPKKVKTASVRPDGTIAKAEPAAHVAAKEAAVKTAARDAAKPAPAKTAALPPARPAKVAAKPADAAAKTAHNDANNRPKSAAQAQQDPQPVQVASAPIEPAPAPKPNPLAFVDTAVSSISGATTKLLDWTRSATNLTHN
ncbi:conserved hypothetical protein [Methylocella silvestris BL2]|uniref:Uncharacterized protein n=1 Tax=Methylocella silvestris (strain DSM 15510 / CIP 108128 / LMG 27833 / NCIMB 13906 / BL2) TaxID=395965 RepID=B8EKH6_METSB|nr:hypothetical protein [Methylocella silvestris]ACK51346.1 conserved hypothetical protein [Methylocella silvestris BL2]